MGSHELPMETDADSGVDAATQMDPKLMEGFRMLLAMALDQHREYWDSVYDKESDEFHLLEQDVELCQEKGVLYEWYGKEVQLLLLGYIGQLGLSPGSRILDLGTGNGHLANLLSIGLGFTNVTGMDYSQSAIRLASAVHEKYLKETHSTARVKWLYRDFLSPQESHEMYDLIIDKGLLDAIAMTKTQDHVSQPTEEEAVNNDSNSYFNPIIKKYVVQMLNTLAVGGYLFICSCNHTMGDLLTLFGPPSQHFHEAPSFHLVANLSEMLDGVILLVFRRI